MAPRGAGLYRAGRTGSTRSASVTAALLCVRRTERADDGVVYLFADNGRVCAARSGLTKASATLKLSKVLFRLRPPG